MTVSNGGGRVAARPTGAPTHCACCVEENPLTWSHQRVMDLLDSGIEGRAVAATMSVEFKTVNKYTHRIADLLGVASRYEALAVCLGRGWITRCHDTDHGGRQAPRGGATVWLYQRELAMLPLIAAGKSFREISAHEIARGRDVSENRAAKSVAAVVAAFAATTRCHLISMLHDYGYGPLPHAAAATANNDP